MSYDLTIKKNGKPYPFDNHLKGGTYAVGGLPYAQFNITFNYGKFFHIGFKGFENGLEDLDGKLVRETIPYLRALLDRLKGEPTSNYWDSTEGNARKAIVDLYYMAENCLDGIWEVSC